MVSAVRATKHEPHILVVDDEADNRRLLNRILSGTARITEAGDGRTALEYLSRESFDLVLLDIMMPDMTGLQVLEIIRGQPSTVDLPVVLISALSDTDDIVRGLQLQANDYIVKPIDIDVVMARVDTQLKLKQTSDLQKQAIAELEAAQQMKDKLLRIASHDLRSPLSNVRMVQILLREYVKDQPEALEILDTLQVTVDKMKGIIEEFLDAPKFQTTGIEIRLGHVEVAEIVAAVAAQYSRMAFDKNIAIQTQDLPGAVVADHARLEQALNNLVTNAIKYSPRDTVISLWSEIRGDRVRINVADQGPGIPIGERDKLFKEFSKLSTRPTAGESSSGLGLWIVRQMVNLQGGEVGVECPLDGGSVFWIELPHA
jgi:two-component system, sensor histidine kinase and response regulator